MKPKIPTAEVLAKFRDEALGHEFDPEFVESLVLLALENELRADGLILAPDEG